MSSRNHSERDWRSNVIHLISLRQEGAYWDYKRQWYNNNSDLLHDIICMANNLENRDAYIIIGIDESSNYDFIDVRNDPNRKNTQQLVDFLKDKPFAGSIRPIAYVQPFCIDAFEIDIIVIPNSHRTPFFLTSAYNGVYANNIYTRVMDTNTPKNKSADINHIEKLWRKRFHLDETPLELIKFYLKSPEDWVDSPTRDRTYFYQYAPEFTISIDFDDRHGYEFYLFGQVNTTPNWSTLHILYHQTTIASFLVAGLDDGRCLINIPKPSGISFSEEYCNWNIFYYSYTTDSLDYALLLFLQRKHHYESLEQSFAFRRFEKMILRFSSHEEQLLFESYIKKNQSRYSTLYKSFDESTMISFPELKGYNMDAFRKQYRDTQILKKMYAEFLGNKGGTQ